MTWEAVESALDTAKSIAFDGCHKIYVLMDDGQTAWMKDGGYGQDDDDSRLIEFEKSAKDDVLAILHDWWEESCGLRFISAVKTVEGDANKGFTDLISQDNNDEE